MTNRVPNFFLIGAPRCGSTYLSQVISSHPEIFLCPMKEPHYFGSPQNGFSYEGPGAKHLNQVWISGRSDYERLYVDATEPVLMDASTNYIYWQSALEAIESQSTDARYVLVLRDPVDRAYSMFRRKTAQGLEPARSLHEAVDAELSGIRDNWIPGYRYLAQSSYAEHIERWLNAVGNRLVVYLYQDVITQPQKIADEIWSLLGLPSVPIQEGDTNATPMISNGLIRKILVRPSGFRSRLAAAAPAPLVDKVKDARNRLGASNVPPRLSQDERDFFQAAVQLDLSRAEHLIGRSIS